MEPVIPRKRPLSMAYHYFGNSKAYVASRPVGKVKFWDPICKEAGYNQKPKVAVTNGMQRKNISASTFNGKDDRLLNSHSVQNSTLKSLEPKESVKNKSYLGSRSTSKVKFWDPTCEAQKFEGATIVVSPNEQIEHKKIQQALAMFDQVFDPLRQENKLKPKDVKMSPFGVSMEAAKINLPISIVDAHRYSNESESSDTLVYCGQGGHGLYGPKSPPEDQTLKTGNLAMRNSIDKKSMVRVIRKVKCFEEDVFVYDGLYNVNNYTQGKSAEGKTLLKFYLNRLPGQPSLQKMLNC
ncbi:hypothetical protein R6Q59_005571 [Mikania micrantha]